MATAKAKTTAIVNEEAARNAIVVPEIKVVAPETRKNRFKILNSIDVNEHVEKKNGLSYLSWAWAWQIFKINFPDSYYTIYEDPNGRNYFTDGTTCWVKTGVTLVDDLGENELPTNGEDKKYVLEHIEYLPIMDFKNKSINFPPQSTEVNKAIQRSLTKAIARHGLGCYIYAGEDLPEEVKQERKSNEERLAASLMQIQPLITTITGKMKTKEEKIAFAKEHIAPFVGTMNYMQCKDPDKMDAFLEHLKSLSTSTAAA